MTIEEDVECLKSREVPKTSFRPNEPGYNRERTKVSITDKSREICANAILDVPCKAEDDLMPCPKCQEDVVGRLCGGIASFGCAEYEYEVECNCGLLFSHQCMSEERDDAIREGIDAWNVRVGSACKIVESRHYLMDGRYALVDYKLSCGHEANLAANEDFFYCKTCGREIENPYYGQE